MTPTDFHLLLPRELTPQPYSQCTVAAVDGTRVTLSEPIVADIPGGRQVSRKLNREKDYLLKIK